MSSSSVFVCSINMEDSQRASLLAIEADLISDSAESPSPPLEAANRNKVVSEAAEDPAAAAEDHPAAASLSSPSLDSSENSPAAASSSSSGLFKALPPLRLLSVRPFSTMQPSVSAFNNSINKALPRPMSRTEIMRECQREENERKRRLRQEDVDLACCLRSPDFQAADAAPCGPPGVRGKRYQ